jgi:hypothetical protein
MERQTFIGANSSVLPGTSTSDFLPLLSVFLNKVKTTNRQGHRFLEYKSAAFDSISFTHIEMSLKRIAIPQNVIKISMHFIKNRKLRALTAYGPSDDFIPERGVPQGGVESPLI